MTVELHLFPSGHGLFFIPAGELTNPSCALLLLVLQFSEDVMSSRNLVRSGIEKKLKEEVKLAK